MVQWAPVTLDRLGLTEDPVVQDWFGNLVVDAYAMRLLGYRTLAKARKGVEATEQSILKLLGAEAGQAANLALVESLGPAGLDPDLPSAPDTPLPSELHRGEAGGRCTCAASPAPSPGAPRRSSATSSPSGCWASPADTVSTHGSEGQRDQRRRAAWAARRSVGLRFRRRRGARSGMGRIIASCTNDATRVPSGVQTSARP